VRVKVTPGVAVSTECAAQVVESVAWVVSDPAVISVSVASAIEAWLTAATLGETALLARIRFKDGSIREVPPQFLLFQYRDVDRIRAVPPPPPSAGSVRILTGQTRLGPYSQASADWRVFVPFTVAEQGRLDVTVDWRDPASRIDFVALGPCPGQCVVLSSTVEGVKPASAGLPRVAPGSFRLSLDNLGPVEETVSYEVWLTPGA
jgi:hypothetical protein